MKRLAFLLTLFFPISGLSAGYLTPLGTGIDIHKVHAHPDGAITLWIEQSSISNPDGCGRTGLVHIKAAGGYETLVSMVLTAYTSGKKIGLWSTGCEFIPFWGGPHTYPVVNNIWITD